MVLRLNALCIDANDPGRLAGFWSDVLGWATIDESGRGISLLPNDDTGFRIRFVSSEESKSGQNQMHLDLTSTTLENQRQTAMRALELGARHIDIGQLPEERHVVLADPEGNEFCVIEPGNSFLADCGFVGALACDGSQEVGYFWSEALGWPLVWDRNQETAIRSPHGGPKISWGGTPRTSIAEHRRLHFELASAEADLTAEIDRLVSLGAARIGADQVETWCVVMADPDGNEFCVRPAREVGAFERIVEVPIQSAGATRRVTA